MKKAIQSQYLAALEMLRQAIVQCPAPLWADAAYKNPFWHIAYHALFYTHLYLQPSGADFVPWAKHREQYERLDAESGFSWLPMNKLELQFYNVRHLQLHTGQLCERLRTAHGIGIDWVSMKADDPA